MKTIHHVVDIDAPKPTVWGALTDPGGLAGWWSTKVEVEPASIGAKTHWTFAGDFNPVMEITRLDPEQRVDWRCIAGHQLWQDNTFRFELHELGDGHTRLRFWQEYATELSDDAYGIYNFNWGYYLESLRVLCSTGTGRPFQP